MGRVLAARNLVQQEYCERKPQPMQRTFASIAGGKLLDANCDPETSNAKLRVAHHVSEKSQQSSPKCKGLFFTHEGKWKQDWMIRWIEWYKYVIAFTRKYLSSGTENNSVSSRAENAKTAWSS